MMHQYPKTVEDPGGGEPSAECHYCSAYLDPRFNWYCVRCARPACDNCSQACQHEGCDEITCSRCVEPHELEAHGINPGPEKR